jgi:RsiW-degrading membrane proteinase PrsW (M82 family)
VIEKACKFLPVFLLIGRHPVFDEPMDGLLYASMGALGFASAENLVLGPFLPGPPLWGRILASPLTHALFAAVRRALRRSPHRPRRDDRLRTLLDPRV